MFESYLNAMLNGAVVFTVDTYFTTQTIGRENITQGVTTALGGTTLVYDYMVFANNIPEIGGVAWVNDYKTVITTFGMNDVQNLLHVTAGTGGQKYASIHMEALFDGLLAQGFTHAALLNPEFYGWWEYYMQLYLHEFTHTVEMYPEVMAHNTIDYHGVLSYYSNTVGPISPGLIPYPGCITEFEVIRLFLLNRAIVNGVPAGVPQSFWHD
jgi:hypothetical protein